jgi:hypothetical protein
MARLAKAAYSPFETDGGTGLSAELAREGLTLVEAFDWTAPPEAVTRRDRRHRGSQAFLAAGPDVVLLIFRGTTDKSGWATNFQAGRRRVKVGDRTVLLHAGFYLAYAQVRDRIEAAVDAEMAKSSRPLVIAGHSLGGALTQIATALSPRPELAACYTFGAPRVSANWFRRALRVPHYRIVNGWDVVPTVPPVLLGYGHTGASYHLKRDPPHTRLGRGRSFLRTVWIYIRGTFGMALGSPWPGLHDHETTRYITRLEHVAGQERQG